MWVICSTAYATRLAPDACRVISCDPDAASDPRAVVWQQAGTPARFAGGELPAQANQKVPLRLAVVPVGSAVPVGSTAVAVPAIRLCGIAVTLAKSCRGQASLLRMRHHVSSADPGTLKPLPLPCRAEGSTALAPLNHRLLKIALSSDTERAFFRPLI